MCVILLFKLFSNLIADVRERARKLTQNVTHNMCVCVIMSPSKSTRILKIQTEVVNKS